MDTNKIREALEAAIVYAPDNEDLMRAVTEALAELDAAPKVLTNEEAGRITDYVYRNGLDGVPKNEIAMAKAGFNFGLRYARDNGYLAPAAGLTVEEVMKVVKTWHSYSDLSPKEAEELSMNETPEEAYEDLRARLTAAIEAKTSK